MEASYFPPISWCMENFSALCSDHDNAVHVVVSVTMLAVTAFACINSYYALDKRFDYICVDRVKQLNFHKMGAMGFADGVYSRDAIAFINSHQEIQPHGWRGY